jgi:hypothetical protein
MITVDAVIAVDAVTIHDVKKSNRKGKVKP